MIQCQSCGSPMVHGDGSFVSVLVRLRSRQGHLRLHRRQVQPLARVHRIDAGDMFCWRWEVSAGSPLDAIADEGVPIRAIAEVVGRHLDLWQRPVACPMMAPCSGSLASVPVRPHDVFAKP